MVKKYVDSLGREYYVKPYSTPFWLTKDFYQDITKGGTKELKASDMIVNAPIFILTGLADAIRFPLDLIGVSSIFRGALSGKIEEKEK